MTTRITSIIALCASAVAVLACSASPPSNVLLNLSRPTDMVNACFMVTRTLNPNGGTSVASVESRPMYECHPAGMPDPDPNAVPKADTPEVKVPFTLGFVPNTERAQLAVVDLNPRSIKPMIDLDRELGVAMAPLGTMPEHASASDDSCRVVTANRGSCDLSLVDATSLARRAQGVDQGAAHAAVSTVTPTTASGRALLAAPAEIQFLPSSQAELQRAGDLCTGTWRAVVTYPGCDLVALIELPSGKILDSYKIGAGGAAIAQGAEPVCSAECGGAGDAQDTDGGVGDDAGTGEPATVGPTALAVQPADTWLPTGVQSGATRIFVGSLRDDSIAVFQAGANALTPASAIPLHENAGGVSRLRLSMDPYGAQLTPANGAGIETDLIAPLDTPSRWAHGTFVGHRGAYLYGLAGDGSVRVVELLAQTECDVAVDSLDPIFTAEPNRRRDACFPVGAAGQPRRRFGAMGPGLRLSTTVTDLTFQEYHLFGDNDDEVRFGTSSGLFPLGGAFAYVLTATGTTYVLNIDPVLRTPKDVLGNTSDASGIPYTEPVPLSNSLRDVNVVSYKSGLSVADGPPRVDTQILTTLQDAHSSLTPALVPQLEQVSTTTVREDARNAVSTPHLTQVFFPDRSTVATQVWTIGWERALPGSARVTGNLGTSGGREVLDDPGASFCKVGVQPGDLLTLTGCTTDNECGVGRTCRRSPSAPQSSGLCFPEDEQSATFLSNACEPLVASLKTYEIVESAPTRLIMRPRIDELAKTPLNRCVTDVDCNPPEFQDRLPEVANRFSCLAVDGVNRCVQSCDPKKPSTPNTRCRAQRLCVPLSRLGASAPGASAGGLCADAPALLDGAQSDENGVSIQQCLPELTPYQIAAGRSFVVTGSSAASAQLTREQGGACVAIQGSSPMPIVRLSLEAPVCTGLPSTDTRTILGSVTPQPDPCLYVVPVTEQSTGGTVTRSEIKALFQNRELRFVLRNLDKYFGNLQIRFEVHGGFRAHTVVLPLGTEFGLPVRIVSSPIEMTLERALPDLNLASVPAGYFDYRFDFVVDTGRVGSVTASGQLLRMHGPLPTYELFNASGNVDTESYFPMP